MREIDGLSYTYDVGELATGASFGNQKLFICTDARSNLLSAWSASDNQWYCGPVRFHFSVGDEKLAPMVTRFFPAYQETIYGTEGVVLSHRIFVPFAAGYKRAVCWLLEVQAEGPRLVEIAVDIQFLPAIDPELAAALSLGQREKQIQLRLERGLVVAQTVPTYYSRFDRTEGRSREVRIFGSSGPPAAHLFTEPGRAQLLYRVLVEGYYDLPFVLGLSPAGQQVAWQGFLALSEISSAFEDTRKQVDQTLAQCHLYTPDPDVNRGLQWAKVNVLRAQQKFRRGPAVVHDPPGDIVAVRDVAWCSLAGSYMSPDDTGQMLRYVAAEASYETGKLADHFHADSGEREDYGLNINNATPLFVVAAHHHAAVTQDDAFLEAIYPAVKRAADYIVLQVQDGLVQCTAEGTNVYGIAGWRNRIPGYTLNGAVTEINALSIWALRAATALARQKDQPDHVERWSAVAEQLTESLNQRLISRETGVYLLARDPSGRQRPTLTGDLVFPILAGVAPPILEERILDLLHGGVFWSEAGVHTVGVNQPEYHPSFADGLMGGVWSALTAWVAYAGRHRYPEHVAEALHRIFASAEPEIPAERGHVVPGQFPEWLDGDTFESLGCALGSRTAAAYLWLGLEGLAGLSPGEDGLSIEPTLPAEWRWLAAARVPCAGTDTSAALSPALKRSEGTRLSFCYHDGALHVNRAVESQLPVQVYDSIEPVADAPGVVLLLSRGGEQRLFVASADQGMDTEIVAGGRRWSVKLAAGEAALLS